ncbi:MAG: hypothetical protein J1F35_07680 [Erysipelotrichales bacterium]|nr:hypothetical protein [Erysipelotrichales bacterium]
MKDEVATYIEEGIQYTVIRIHDYFYKVNNETLEELPLDEEDFYYPKEIAASIDGKDYYVIIKSGEVFYKRNLETDKIEKLSAEDAKIYLNVPILDFAIKEAKKRRQEEIRAYRIEKFRKSEQKRKKLLITALLGLLTITLVGGLSIHAIKDKKLKNNINKIYETSDLSEAFRIIANINKTLSDTQRVEIMEYINILLERELSDECYKNILTCLAYANFSKSDKISAEDLEELFKGNENKKFLAEQLYNYKNGISLSYNKKYSLIANLISLYEPSTNMLLEGNSINNLLKDIYEIDDNIDINNEFVEDGDGLEVQKYIEEVENNTLEGITSTTHLASNIFEPYIKAYEEMLGCYFYFAKETREGISYDIYFKKLCDLVYSKEELDYNNREDRILVYFYANAYLGVVDENDAISPAKFIMNGTDSVFSCFDMIDLMVYFSNGDLYLNDAYKFSHLMIGYGDISIPLLQEVNLCLKKDLEEGLILQKDYDRFLKLATENVEIFAPESLDEFKRANDANRSMNGYKLEIIPKITL